MYNFGDMQKLLAEMQKNIEKAMSELEAMTVEGESGAGMVKVKANGKREIISIFIDDSLLKTGDKEMIEDLVAAAVNDALSKAEALASQHLGSSAQGLLTMFPGFKFGGVS
ncbi:MAG: YbaB/EbfC family nucleoid-associated protein [Candidatus Kryptoniota bacterium]